RRTLRLVMSSESALESVGVQSALIRDDLAAAYILMPLSCPRPGRANSAGLVSEARGCAFSSAMSAWPSGFSNHISGTGDPRFQLAPGTGFRAEFLGSHFSRDTRAELLELGNGNARKHPAVDRHRRLIRRRLAQERGINGIQQLPLVGARIHVHRARIRLYFKPALRDRRLHSAALCARVPLVAAGFDRSSLGRSFQCYVVIARGGRRHRELPARRLEVKSHGPCRRGVILKRGIPGPCI